MKNKTKQQNPQLFILVGWHTCQGSCVRFKRQLEGVGSFFHHVGIGGWIHGVRVGSKLLSAEPLNALFTNAFLGDPMNLSTLFTFFSEEDPEESLTWTPQCLLPGVEREHVAWAGAHTWHGMRRGGHRTSEPFLSLHSAPVLYPAPRTKAKSPLAQIPPHGNPFFYAKTSAWRGFCCVCTELCSDFLQMLLARGNEWLWKLQPRAGARSLFWEWWRGGGWLGEIGWWQGWAWQARRSCHGQSRGKAYAKS